MSGPALPPAIDRLLDLAALPAMALPAAGRRMARISLFDWMVCGLAGADEPVSVRLRAAIGAEGGHPVASIIGGGAMPARAAALVNGATSHALDYDDTHFGHVGHPSVAIFPAALAVAEEVGAGAAEMVDAFLIGAEASVRIGMLLGAAHYNRGFHQTATAGAFGATLAAGRLYGLPHGQMRAAIGLCASRASGLKLQFGTMGKPLNAGIAASNGVECAMLAQAGLSATADGLEGEQGFVPTHSDAPVTAGDRHEPLPGRFLFEDVRYKLHACCHGTHAMIEALAGLAAQGLTAADVAAIRLRTNPRWLRVCDIKAPRSGLEIKFSYAWLAGMVLSGIPTAAETAYTDACAADPALAAFARRVEVCGDADLSDMQAAAEVTLTDGRVRILAHDLAMNVPLAVLEANLRTKAQGLLGDRAGVLGAAVAGLDRLAARDFGVLLRRA
ncbi:MAG: MmgE/PrpD family protein [Rhodobacteraceae bacterium]|jgi:2-methylcitrate dehydratase PrpD|nr:MmgE/PrpD family protein [Paracoccaceae bacterium]